MCFWPFEHPVAGARIRDQAHVPNDSSKRNAMLTIHHLNNSRSLRMLWLLEELGQPYEIKQYRRDGQTHRAPAELTLIHPLGKSPVITDGDITVAESGAIVEYLVDTYGHGRLKPAVGTAARREYTYWLHYAEGSLMPLLLMGLMIGRRGRSSQPGAQTVAREIRESFLEPELKKHLAFVDRHLANIPWFAGTEVSGADMQMGFVLDMADGSTPYTKSLPHVQAYLQRMRQRPAYQAAEAKGGSNDYNFT